MSTQSQFAAKVKELIAQSKNLSLSARKNVLELLDEARKKILGELADINPQSYSAAQLNVLKHSIDNAMETFRAKATSAIDGYESQGFSLGVKTAAEPLMALG